MKKKKMKQDLRRRRQFEKEKRHIDEIAAARENIRREQQQFMDETRQNEIKRRQEYIKSLNIEPDKPTRASKLKEEAAKKQLEKVQIENNRQKLNHDIQKVNQKEKAKKINDFIYELNTRKDDEKKLLVKKQALKKKENQWMKWLDLTEQANKTRETMLERIYEQW
ncbi:hypothetical protein TRFO_03922 [Tritrichomonas foetus]|uniref:Trichohyalin-plectin-homology domain-containing protein n=1 Tax=Tritrichomonas foetus TaxID=1144522 RepID=A0A1J4KPG6_9EUKA|nr:hypothetical protein TRFO_03922 [Tritrichomonas foetus]|eukprot:OHT11684.1 hypothetical protein TRFO_03922 [Tritrichomonas foetus]